MNSMTGYGRGEGAGGGYKISAELSSVNRKAAEVAVNLPRELDALEGRIRNNVLSCVSRGRVSVRINYQAVDGFKPRSARINGKLAKSLHADLARLQKELKEDAPISLDAILRVPGVIESSEEETDADAVWPAVKQALDKGLGGLVAMRQREGQNIARDLKKRIKTIHGAVKKIGKLAPAVPKRYREQLHGRLAKAGLEELDLDDERLLKELLIFSDRSDISEELTRLQSHFDQFAETIADSEPVGRKIDFLCQEMNREINTIGSKAQDAGISREVVIAKTELEKFREQVQNVE